MRNCVFCLTMLVSLEAALAMQVTTLTFEELPFQPVDGLSFRGVSFDFKIDDTASTDAFYASFGPGSLSTVSDPSLTGNSTGILTLDFALPTEILEFGVALNTANPLMPGFEVELFDMALQSLGMTPVNTETAIGALGFSEAPFTYEGVPIRRAVIDFADAPSSFALDNLTYQIPEPSTLVLATLLVVVMLPRVRRFAMAPE